MVRRLAPLAIALVVVAGIVVDTTYLGPEEAAAVNPADFDPQTYAAETFPALAEAIEAEAVDLTELAPAVAADPAAAAEEHGTDIGSGRHAFPVTVTGTVAEVDADFLLLTVPELPEDVVRVPLSAALSGTPVRDVTGTISFGDFPSQTAYQNVANELALTMRSTVLDPADPPALVGQEVEVVGVYVTGGPPNAYLVQPVAIEPAP